MKRATILLIVMILAFCISTVSALGFGIAPINFTIEDASRGETYDQVLGIRNTDDESCNYEFEWSGEIGDWVSFFALDGNTPIDTITVPGKSLKKIIARFLVPSETSNGVYTGTIYVKSIPDGATMEGTGAAADVVLRMPSEGAIEVTGGVLVELETATAETSTETPTVTETPTPTTETVLAAETPTVTETPTPTTETVLATETPTEAEAETDTKVPGFGFICTLIATIVVFVIAKKSGQKRKQ